jgi:nicotinamidase-related amidase
MELQRGVVGDLATFPALREAVATNNAAFNAGLLCQRSRELSWPVVHCLAEFEPNWAGSVINTPLHRAMRRIPGHLVRGSDACGLVPEVSQQPSDFVVARSTGVSPFIGTGLDQLLRSLGVTVLIVTGVSVNLGVLGLCVEAANLGYQLVVATNAVAGTPQEYATSALKESIALVATLATTEEILAAVPLH